MNDAESRVVAAYYDFRRSFRSSPPPHWEGLSDWQRDAIRMAYLRGKQDAERLRTAPEQIAQSEQSEYTIIKTPHGSAIAAAVGKLIGAHIATLAGGGIDLVQNAEESLASAINQFLAPH